MSLMDIILSRLTFLCHRRRLPRGIEKAGACSGPAPAQGDHDSMSKAQDSEDSGSRASSSSGYATCQSCGQPLTDRERQIGDACERCERDYIAAYNPDDDGYPRAA
jgi:hypothetical protein